MVTPADDADLLARLKDDRISGHGVVDLTLAMMTAGIGLKVSGKVADPVHLVFLNDGDDASGHAVIVTDIAENASFTLVSIIKVGAMVFQRLFFLSVLGHLPNSTMPGFRLRACPVIILP